MRVVAMACLAILGVACGSAECPEEVAPVGVQSADLRSDGGEALVQCETCPVEAFAPHQGVSPIDMTIDAEAGRVILRYQRDGKQIEEIWRMGDRTML